MLFSGFSSLLIPNWNRLSVFSAMQMAQWRK